MTFWGGGGRLLYPRLHPSRSILQRNGGAPRSRPRRPPCSRPPCSRTPCSRLPCSRPPCSRPPCSRRRVRVVCASTVLQRHGRRFHRQSNRHARR